MPTIPANFKYVVIPAKDDSEPFELSHARVSLENDLFISHVKSIFARTENSVDRNQLKKQIESNAKQTVDDSFMDSIIGSVSLDIVSLALPTKDSNYFSVSMYCDDKGISKNLPVNTRAIQLANACGLAGHRFLGDVVISRIFDDNETEWFRSDFSTKDLDYSSPWIQRAKTLNLKRGSTTSLSSLTQQFVNSQQQNAQQGTPQVQSAAEQQPLMDRRGKTVTFTETEEDAELSFSGLEGVNKKDIKVVIGVDSLKIQLNNEDIFNSKLPQKISTDDSSWSLTGGRLSVSLEKKNKQIWGTIQTQL